MSQGKIYGPLVIVEQLAVPAQSIGLAQAGHIS